MKIYYGGRGNGKTLGTDAANCCGVIKILSKAARAALQHIYFAAPF